MYDSACPEEKIGTRLVSKDVSVSKLESPVATYLHSINHAPVISGGNLGTLKTHTSN